MFVAKRGVGTAPAGLGLDRGIPIGVEGTLGMGWRYSFSSS
jgi:hypothetical protein